jgi:hypothetical protein
MIAVSTDEGVPMPRWKLWRSKRDKEKVQWAYDQFANALGSILVARPSLSDATAQTKYRTDYMLGRAIALAEITGRRNYRSDVDEALRWYQQAGVEPDGTAVADGMKAMGDEWNARWRNQTGTD